MSAEQTYIEVTHHSAAIDAELADMRIFLAARPLPAATQDYAPLPTSAEGAHQRALKARAALGLGEAAFGYLHTWAV